MQNSIQKMSKAFAKAPIALQKNALPMRGYPIRRHIWPFGDKFGQKSEKEYMDNMQKDMDDQVQSFKNMDNLGFLIQTTKDELLKAKSTFFLQLLC
jgi:hypothetical protein